MNAPDLAIRLSRIFGHHAVHAPYQTVDRRDVCLDEYARVISRIEQNPLAKQARKLLEQAFENGQRDCGTLHTTHSVIVARGSVLMAMRDQCSYEDLVQQYIVGLLHDVKEDRKIFTKDVNSFARNNLAEDFTSAINILTKPEKEPRFENISRVMKNRIAMRGKYADSSHNGSMVEQMPEGAQGRQRHSYRSYAISCSAILAVLEGRIPANAGMLGYLMDIGKDLITQRNMPLFRKNFRDVAILQAVLDKDMAAIPEKYQTDPKDKSWHQRCLEKTAHLNPDRNVILCGL